MAEQLISVGIDIGTSTTQVIFSRLTIDNTASAHSVPRVAITDKQTIYRSPIYPTPLKSPAEIDASGIHEIVVTEYKGAGIKPGEVSTGAVIITGETARKENASSVLSAISGLAGKFVVATAGPELESIIAGKGSGTASVSEHRAGVMCNIDIGGGTTNIAFFKLGVPIDTCCLDVGGRLVQINYEKYTTYVAPKLKKLCEKQNLRIAEGIKADSLECMRLCRILALAILETVGLSPTVHEDSRLLVLDRLPKAGTVPEYLTFSGGVADCIYEEKADDFAYGDIGVLLGKAVREAFAPFQSRIERPAETIRATVIGAGTHSTELSGSTITYTKNSFPLKNVPIIKPLDEETSLVEGRFASELANALKLYGMQRDQSPVALALAGHPNARYAYVQLLADALCEGMRTLLENTVPLIILLENDMGKVLGHALQLRLPSKDILCLDMLKAQSGDFIDIGAPVSNGRALPVVIKTLVFN